jgi:hypothetical protein
MTFRLSARPLLAAFALTAVLAGCDASTDTPDAATATADTEDAALSVAGALALDGGGLLEDAAAGAALAGAPVASFSPPDGHPGFPVRPGCRPTRAFDAATSVYTLTFDCSRTSEGGRFSASFSRVATVQFLDAAGEPQAERAGATALNYDVLSGTSAFVTPRASHHLLSLTADFAVTDLDEDLVTVNGTYARAATDTLSGARGQRTLTHELALTLDDVRGPRGVRENWHRAVSGAITGTYHAVHTATARDGTTTTREITRTIAITLPAGGSETAEIAVDGRRFRADRRTGAVEEID